MSAAEGSPIVESKTARPFVKMAGGKTKLLPKLLPLVPDEIGTYVEPFVGGGALFFALASEWPRRFRRAVLADTNADLIATYRAVRDNVEDVIRRLRGMRNSERFYYRVRDLDLSGMLDSTPGLDAAIACRTIFLNKTCFNGLHRTNRDGKFNVPFGHYSNPNICDEDNLRAASRALNGVTINLDDFESIRHPSAFGPRDFVFADPPYLPVKPTSFVGYGPDRFGPSDHVRLRNYLAELQTRSVPFVHTNADTEATRALYDGFEVRRVEVPRAINRDGKGRGGVGELIIR